MEVAADATVSLGKGLKKSIKTYSKEAERFARSLSDIVDVEDIVKTIHKAANPEEHENRMSNVIVHKPIDWSKHPPSGQPGDSKNSTLQKMKDVYHNKEKAEHSPKNTKRVPSKLIDNPLIRETKKILKNNEDTN